MAPRILIVDDDQSSLTINSFVLKAAGYDVTTAQRGTQVLSILDHEIIDLVILDIMMPLLDGYDTLAQIRERYDVPVIFLSARAAVQDKIKGLESGADDYLTKPFEPRELLARVQAVLRRTNLFQAQEMDTQIQLGPLRLSTVTNQFVDESGKAHELTPIECRLLYTLMHNAGRTLSHDHLFQAVWGYDYDGSSNQIAVYVRRLRAKIEPQPHSPRYLTTVRGVGYRFDAPS